jgi:hypothetical protein
MKKTKKDHYRYAYICDLCTEYRKAAIESGTRKGAVAAMWSPVKNALVSIESSSNMLDSFSSFSKQIASLSSGSVDKLSEVSEKSTGGGGEVTEGCEDTENEKTILGSVGNILDAEWSPQKQAIEIKSASNQLFIDQIGSIEGIDEDILKYMEECWDCDLKVSFDWQLQPLNLLAGLGKFLRDIESIIDQITDALDPSKFLMNFCEFFDGFRWICPPDLIALMLSIALLIKKYMMLAVNLNIDWTAIVGPLLKWIVDAIASFLQQIVQVIVAPLDCVIGVLQSVQNLIDTTDALGDSVISATNYLTAGLGDMFEGETKSSSAIIASKGNDTFTDYYYKKEKSESISKQFTSVNEEIKTNENADFENTKISNVTSSIAETQEGGPQVGGFKLARDIVDENARKEIQSNANKLAIPTGFSVGVNDTFDSFFAQRKKDKEEGNASFDLSQISIFKTSMLAVQSARQYIVDFFNQILFALTSLNTIFQGKLSLSVESLGMIIMLIDLIKMIKMLIELKHNNCDSPKDNPEQVLSTMKRQYPDMDFELTGINTIERIDSNLYNVKVELDPCNSQPDSDQALRAKKLKDSVRRISGLKLA